MTTKKTPKPMSRPKPVPTQNPAIPARLKTLRAEIGISQRDFAKRIYISQSLYAELEIGNRNINNRIIHLIAMQFKVNKNWIKTGDGEMFDDDPPDVRLEQLLELFDELAEPLQDYLILQAKELCKIQQNGITQKPE
ncbi:MAG: helix-turn-helix domain-containing protein [Treponema sp.]|nr:helix-turn-helix domain-containing protein [Treponema sp.]